MTNSEAPRLIPTGTCWCGCGQQTSLGSFFARGHDKVAEAALLTVKYEGSVAHLLHANGYGPGHSITDAAVRSGKWIRCTRPGCNYAGTKESVRNHEAKHDKK